MNKTAMCALLVVLVAPATDAAESPRRLHIFEGHDCPSGYARVVPRPQEVTMPTTPPMSGPWEIKPIERWQDFTIEIYRPDMPRLSIELVGCWKDPPSALVP